MRCHHRHRQHLLSPQTRPATPPLTLARLATLNHSNSSLTRPHIPPTVPRLTARHTAVSSGLLFRRLSPLSLPPTIIHRPRLPHSLPLANQSRRRRSCLRKPTSSRARTSRIGIIDHQRHSSTRPANPPQIHRHKSQRPSPPYHPLRSNQHASLRPPDNSPHSVSACSPQLPAYDQRSRSSPRSWRPAASGRSVELESLRSGFRESARDRVRSPDYE